MKKIGHFLSTKNVLNYFTLEHSVLKTNRFIKVLLQQIFNFLQILIEFELESSFDNQCAMRMVK